MWLQKYLQVRFQSAKEVWSLGIGNSWRSLPIQLENLEYYQNKKTTDNNKDTYYCGKFCKKKKKLWNSTVFFFLFLKSNRETIS